MNVIAKADKCLFTAFALLNATGYNAENGWLFGEVRKRVRLKLAGRAKYWRSALADAGILDALHRAGGAMLMDMIPLLSPPPNFTLDAAREEYTASWQNKSKVSVGGVDSWLARFYEEERIDQLWDIHLPDFESAVAGLEQLKPFLETIFTQYVEPSIANLPDVILMPNLLDAKGRGYSLSSTQRTWLFLSPLSDPAEAEELAAHEFLHRWIDIAAEDVIDQNEIDLMPYAKAEFRIVADSYPELSIWIGETAVRASTIWLMRTLRNYRAESVSDSLTKNEQLGFIGIRNAYDYLERNSTKPMRDSVPAIVELVSHQIAMRYRSMN